MGSVSRIASLERFLERHGEQLRSELLAELPPSLVALSPTIETVNEVDRVAVVVSWVTAAGSAESVALEGLSAEAAAEMDAADFDGDCDMGW